MTFPVDSVVLILVLAIALDVGFGELPTRWHPVAWMGRGIEWFGRRRPTTGRALPFAAGVALVASGAVACALLGWQVERITIGQPFVVALLVQAFVLKQTFSIKSLARAATAVEANLRVGDLGAARQQLAFHLVSRDATGLDESQVAAATIESVAENASDSIVAPLFYFALVGLPGALAYRFVNTCDAMVGYRTERLEWFGKAAARLDDLLNFVPARLTAVTLLAAGGVVGAGWSSAWSAWRRDRHSTSSPNAGQPMSAAAGVLGVELEKVGHYRLGSGLRAPTVADIGRAIRLLWVTSAITTMAVVLWLLCKGTF